MGLISGGGLVEGGGLGLGGIGGGSLGQGGGRLGRVGTAEGWWRFPRRGRAEEAGSARVAGCVRASHARQEKINACPISN